MSRTCTICQHSQREMIEDALQRGEALRPIAGRFGTSKTALHRHKENCLPIKLTTRGVLESYNENPDISPDPILRIEGLIRKLELMLRKVEKPGRAALFYQGAREIVRATELLERMKAHYGEIYKQEMKRHEQIEREQIHDMLMDPLFLEAIQHAYDEIEKKYIAAGKLNANPY